MKRMSGVPRQVIARLESGTRQSENMTVGVARRLARALGVSVDHLIGMYDEGSELLPTALALAGT
jgi:transcriptional regulator with XRE-family HTH domain